MIFLALSGVAHSKDLEKGIYRLRHDEYRKALSNFRKALKSTDSDGEKAEIYKMIGIAIYYEKGPRIAVKAFRKALKLNPEVTITQVENKNPKIDKLFADVKGPSQIAMMETPITLSTTKKTPFYLHLLPFGVTQFYQDKPWRGSLIAAVGVSSAFFYFDRDNSITQIQKQLDEVDFKQNTTGSIDELDYLNFVNDSRKATDTAKSEQQIALGVFFLNYAYQIIDSTLFAPEDKPVRVSLQKEKKRLSLNISYSF